MQLFAWLLEAVLYSDFTTVMRVLGTVLCGKITVSNRLLRVCNERVCEVSGVSPSRSARVSDSLSVCWLWLTSTDTSAQAQVSRLEHLWGPLIRAGPVRADDVRLRVSPTARLQEDGWFHTHGFWQHVTNSSRTALHVLQRVYICCWVVVGFFPLFLWMKTSRCHTHHTQCRGSLTRFKHSTRLGKILLFGHRWNFVFIYFLYITFACFIDWTMKWHKLALSLIYQSMCTEHWKLLFQKLSCDGMIPT